MLVTGGPANSGTRRVKQLAEWTCRCGIPIPGKTPRYVRRGHLGTTYSCPDCGDRRPDAS